jgi:hypothetical protein
MFLGLFLAPFDVVSVANAANSGQMINFDLSKLNDAFSNISTTTSKYLKDLSMGQLNPTFGSTSTIGLEFLTLFGLDSTNAIVLNLPSFATTENLRARLSQLDTSGSVVQYSRWRSFNEITGTRFGLPTPSSILSMLLNPTSSSSSSSSTTTTGMSTEFDALRLLIPIDFPIKAGTNVRLELEGAKAPSFFSDFSTLCQSAFESASPTDFIVKNNGCCNPFALGILTDVYNGVTGGTFEVPVGAVACPNYGTTAASYAPTLCSTTEGEWSSSLQSSCCQYEQYLNTDKCRNYRCNTNWNPTECCDITPPSTSPKKDSTCPVCSAGNWDVSICCDRYNTDVPEYKNNYENDSRCDAVFCACEDWSTERCCFKYSKNNPFYEQNGLKCPTCTDPTNPDDWNADLCCRLSTYWGRPECSCRTENGGVNYNPDLCCQDVLTASPLYCPRVTPPEENEIPPEECSEDIDCDCGCDSCDAVDEEPSCPCELFSSGAIGPTADTPTANSYVKYEKHSLDVDNVTSGHNTVIINHLHIDTHIDLANESDVAKLQDLLPSVLLQLNSGTDCNGGVSTLDQIVAEVRNGVQQQVDRVSQAVTKVGTDVQKSVGDVVGLTKNVVESTVNGIADRFTTDTGNAASALLGKPTRQVVQLNTSKPLNAVQLILLRLALITQTSFTDSFVNFISQVPTTNSASSSSSSSLSSSSNQQHSSTIVQASQNTPTGYSITYDVYNPRKTATEMATQLNDGRTTLASEFKKALGIDASISEALVVAGSNDTKTQKELFYPCTSNDDCLSNNCSKDKVCAEAANSAIKTASISFIFALIAIICVFM